MKLVESLLAFCGTDEYTRIQTLHRLPRFVYLKNPDFGLQEMLPSLFWSTIYIWGIFVISTMLGTHVFYRNVPRGKILQGAYKLTQFIGNVSNMWLGYYFYNRLPKDATMEEKIVGFIDVYPLLCLQVSKQLWDLLICVLLERQEHRINYLHHSGVALVSFSLMSFTIGMRYFVPFMLGIMQTSSIILVGLEVMKDYPQHGSQRYPQLFFALQIAFAISFLYIRCYLFLPQAYTILRWSLWALLSVPPGSESLIIQGLAWAIWSAGFVLIFLQAYWGFLIIKKLIRDIVFGKKKLEKEKM